ncbi:PBP1A family penicillin-binding protein [Parvularcula sp. LCG005]|uniref:transglycosylase domain-containing protein n=1 Tax=Parvularcula sp. LCG005 TaxID=3078805 RepID=UPI002941F07E|nr:PBP1A family penicillin-binding protein [Parvularcula sp. LCG005]WOI53593.1 PBP1A family penicillin-binding protein [Parvularcula sp. LCG005]
MRKTTSRTASSKPRRPVRRVKAGSTRRKKSQSWTAHLPGLMKFAGRVTVVAILGVAVFAGILVYYGRGLPEVGNLAAARKQPRITVVDRFGHTIGIHGQDRGDPVDTAELPEHVVQAFLATEDRNFYHHVGVNPIAILRALTINMREGGVAQGGSTITQQLVKNLILTPEQTLERKVQEMILALRIEARYDKNEILGLYLNAVYFGNGAYGLEAASRRYFGKSPKELNLGEAAMLAGLLKAPSRFSPTNSENLARTRAAVVLHAMVDANFITRQEADAIIAQGVADVIEDDRRTSYAADYAVTEAERLLSGIDEDIIVHTTIDGEALRRTDDARRAIAADDPLYAADIQTAAIAMEEDGAIRVLIGGNDYAESVYNRAVKAMRQPGSVFKTFVYLAAIENGWEPEDLVDDTPVVIGNYHPNNYKDRYYGPVELTEALSRSLNAAAIRLQEEVGRNRVVDVARRAGFDGLTDVGASLALGTMEATPLTVAQSYLPLSNGGYRTEPYIIVGITTASGRTLYEREPPSAKAPIFDSETLVAFDYMLRHVVSAGSGVHARLPVHQAAGKTGTSQDSRDAWFAGYASGVVGVVWLGKDNNEPMETGRGYISGSGAPARVWAAMMTETLGDRPAREPVPYVPRRKKRSLFEHLADILNGKEEPADYDEPEELNSEELGRLLDEVAVYECTGTCP